MKKKKLLRAFGLADEKYVAEADPEKAFEKSETASPKISNKIRIKRWTAVAACLLAVITALNVVLFIPYNTTPPSVKEYANSEYYSIIEKLNELTYKKPKYKNLFGTLAGGFMNIIEGGFLPKGDAMDAPTAEAPLENTNGQQYQETTDNQVSGVTEADRIKRSDKYIYYLCDEALFVYSIEGEDTELVGSYGFTGFSNAYYDDWEFYLSKDCNTVTVIAPNYNRDHKSTVVTIISLDVSDPTNIAEKGRVSVAGGYISTRVVDGKMLLMTNFRVALNDGKVDFSDEYSFVPSIDKGNGFELLPIGDIISPETLTSARYTVICKLDEATLAFEDATALLSYSENVYVSTDKIFATHGYTEKVDEGNATLNVSMTDISAIYYGQGEMKYLGTSTVKGYVKDQYSLDEYDGMLRVVTTTSATLERISKQGNGVPLVSAESVGTNASLYCISLESYEIIASVEEFAPKGETVRSVRFDGTDAYVCTAVQLTDPVFFFDLSDVNNITYKETGTIEGFSTSLVNFGNGYLLGIGRGDSWSSLKIEVYEESADGVVSVAAFEMDNAYYSENYKSYYVNRDMQMMGLGISTYAADDKYATQRYIVVQFDGYKLREMVNVELGGNEQHKRGVYIDGYMYMFGGNDFKVVEIK